MRSHWTMTASGNSVNIDAAELRRALGYLVAPNECHEVRALPSGRSRLIRGDDLDAAVRAIEELADGTGVYLTSNPVRPDLGETRAAKNTDVTRRRNYYIDVDPVRPKGVNATDAEHEAARVVAEAVQAELAERGWPTPIVVDSGSGWHLHYAIDLPNDRLSQQIISRSLKALAKSHDSEGAKVDPGVHNAARIIRLPGTWNRKGSGADNRPHRLCRIVSVPVALEPVTVEQLKDLADLPKPTEQREFQAPRNEDAWKATADDGSRAYARSAMEREVGKVATAGENRNNQLHESALKLGGYVAGGLLEEQEVIDALTRAGQAVGLGTDGDPLEIRRAITNGLEFGKTTPKHGPEPTTKAGKQQQQQSKKPIDPGSPLIVWANTIVPKKVEFLWPGRIPLGKMTTFAGHGGLGKTFVICDIAARVTNGDEWPFGGGECAEPGNVLFISGEDDEDDTLVPRLIECGADTSRVAFLTADAHDNFTLAALDLLTASLDRMTDVRLVAIDPPTSYLGGIDDHKNAELRSVLGPLKRWASEHRVAIILNTHVNKATGPNVDAASRVMGSVAWVNAVRAAHMFFRDPDDKDRVIFAPLKMNNAKRPMGLAYRIKPTEGDMARVEWLGLVDQDADEAMGRDKKKPRLVSAKDWLISIFRQQREWPSELFWASAKENGITKYAIDEAKAKLDVPRARRTIGAGGDVTYTWWVPHDWPHLSDDGSNEDQISANRDGSC